VFVAYLVGLLCYARNKRKTFYASKPAHAVFATRESRAGQPSSLVATIGPSSWRRDQFGLVGMAFVETCEAAEAKRGKIHV